MLSKIDGFAAPEELCSIRVTCFNPDQDMSDAGDPKGAGVKVTLMDVRHQSF